MIDPNQDGFFTSFVEIFKTGLAVTQVYVEFPKQMVQDTTAAGVTALKTAKMQLSVTAYLISKQEDRGEPDDYMTEEDEYEVEFVYKEEENMYEIPLASGHYMVVLKYPGIDQISEHIVISPLETGNTILNY